MDISGQTQLTLYKHYIQFNSILQSLDLPTFVVMPLWLPQAPLIVPPGAPNDSPRECSGATPDGMARFLSKLESLLDRTTDLCIPPPKEKRHNIWAERLPERPHRQNDIGAQSNGGRLCTIPEELLIHIMRNLDVPSLLCLRRTSRQFMRLFGDRTFRGYHGDRDITHWQSENVKAIESRKQLRIFREQLGRDRLCKDCTAARAGPNCKMDAYQSWSEELLHCNGCDVDHPSCAFSRKQRALSPSKRVCTAREGFIRICKHKTITWADLETAVFRSAAPARKGSTIFACNRRHERREVRFAFYGSSFRIAMAEGTRWRERISKVEYDWDADVPWAERDWCPERDYTWLSAEADARERKRLVPESYWYRQLEPASFGVTGEKEGFGVTWCRTRSCPSFFRLYELRRGRRVHAPCVDGCGK